MMQTTPDAIQLLIDFLFPIFQKQGHIPDDITDRCLIHQRASLPFHVSDPLSKEGLQVFSLQLSLGALTEVFEEKNPMGLKEDKYLIVALALAEVAEAHTDPNASTWNSLVVLLVKFFFQHHIEQMHHYADQYHLTTACTPTQRKELEESMSSYSVHYAYDVCKFPMEYRTGPGGDRDVNHVLRTLFELRREEMQNVQIAIDIQKGGFKLIAKRLIQADEMFLIEKPFASFNGHAKHTNPTTCAHCMNSLCPLIAPPDMRTSKHITHPASIVKCRGCGDVYCTDQCKRDAFFCGHKRLCIGTETGKNWEKHIQRYNLHTAKTVFSFNVFLALKLMVKAECLGLPSALELPEIKILRRAMDTNEPFDPRSPEGPPLMTYDKAIKLRSMFNSFQSDCPKLLSSQTNMIDFIRVYSAVSLNVVGGDDQHGGLKEAKVYLALSFANHDCDPNTSFSSCLAMAPLPGGKLEMIQQVETTLKAKRDISEGEEITINYISHCETFEQRCLVLAVSYGIDNCSCAKCERDRNQIASKEKKESKK
jgi:hypothetical protein